MKPATARASSRRPAPDHECRVDGDGHACGDQKPLQPGHGLSVTSRWRSGSVGPRRCWRQDRAGQLGVARCQRPSALSASDAIANDCAGRRSSCCPRRAGSAGSRRVPATVWPGIAPLSAVPHVVRIAKAEISVNDMSPSAGVSGRAFSDRSVGASSLGDEGAVGDRCDDAGHPVCAPSGAAIRGTASERACSWRGVGARWFQAACSS